MQELLKELREQPGACIWELYSVLVAAAADTCRTVYSLRQFAVHGLGWGQMRRFLEDLDATPQRPVALELLRQ